MTRFEAPDSVVKSCFSSSLDVTIQRLRNLPVWQFSLSSTGQSLSGYLFDAPVGTDNLGAVHKTLAV